MANTPFKASNLTLDRWLRDIARGDRDALENLYQVSGSAVYAYALSILKNRTDAEDVLHDTFVTIWNSAGEYRSLDKPMAWIITITRNHCYKMQRYQRRYLPLEAEDCLSGLAMDPEDKLMLVQCMKVLTDEERQIVILHAVAGFRHREIAEMLKLNTSTVLSKYHRAIQKMRSHFRKEEHV